MDGYKKTKTPCPAGVAAHKYATRPANAGLSNLHLLEQMREGPADGEIFLATLHLHRGLTTKVA